MSSEVDEGGELDLQQLAHWPLTGRRGAHSSPDESGAGEGDAPLLGDMSGSAYSYSLSRSGLGGAPRGTGSSFALGDENSVDTDSNDDDSLFGANIVSNLSSSQ